ncbi:MAG: hypothetical protein P4M11_07245 [Candidatus Pacebacteria bacterium]|nr:hypothetical protein [Candidatus Paceibacterota bacterium]
MPPHAVKHLSCLASLSLPLIEREISSPLTGLEGELGGIKSAARERLKLQSLDTHCGLMRSRDPYFDCPAPAAHEHASE